MTGARVKEAEPALGGASGAEPTRLLVLTHEPVRDGGDYTRLGYLIPALERRLRVAGHFTPETPRLTDLFLKARYVHPDRIAWRERAWLNARRFRARTRSAARELNRRAGEFDVVLLVQTMFGIEEPPVRPFAIYTDNLLVLTRRYYPAASKLSAREARSFIELEADQCRRASLLFPWSRFVARSMVEDYGCDPNRIVVTPAAPRFPPQPLERRRWGSRIALFVGKDFERKGGLELLAAWPRVRAQVPGATLRIAGPRRQPKSLPLGVEWLGPVPDARGISRLYGEADAFVMPSRYEPWGLTFLEAMAHGTACISGSVGAQPEVVREGASGRNIEVSDPDSLIEGLVELLSDPRKAEEMGRGGWQQVCNEATWDRIAGRLAVNLVSLARGSS